MPNDLTILHENHQQHIDRKRRCEAEARKIRSRKFLGEPMASFDYISIQQGEHEFLLTALPASLLTEVSYAAVRRKDDEVGAVQRVLISSRIEGIRDFALTRGDFPASIVLNWVGKPLVQKNGKVDIPAEEKSAQIIDGQHRVAGLKLAMEDEPEIADMLIPVAIYSDLDTKQSARIFLSINTEQRPVPKSLVFDLYGIAGDELMDPAALRARDIVSQLNDPGEPYEGLIKFPNQGYRRGGIALSTAVDTLKPLVEPKAVLEQVGANTLEIQSAVFLNYFRALRKLYGEEWNGRNNALIYAGGFIGSIQFFRTKLIDYCVTQKSFEQTTIEEALRLSPSNRILQEEISGLGGSEASSKVLERLTQMFVPDQAQVQLKF